MSPTCNVAFQKISHKQAVLNPPKLQSSPCLREDRDKKKRGQRKGEELC